jgi:predicted nucleotidyltransferase
MVAQISREDALTRLTSEERKAVEQLVDRLRAVFGGRLRDVRLYGSKARGESHDESDIDVLVLLDGAGWEDQSAAIDLASSINPWLSATVRDFELYHSPVSRATGFYEELRRESVKLLPAP